MIFRRKERAYKSMVVSDGNLFEAADFAGGQVVHGMVKIKRGRFTAYAGPGMVIARSGREIIVMPASGMGTVLRDDDD